MTLDELIGRAAAFIHEAYQMGRRDAAAAIAAEAQKMLGAPAIAPKPAASAATTDTPREHQGLARTEAPGNALDNDRPAEAGRGDSLEPSRTPAVPLEGRSDDGAAVGDKPAVSATDARPAVIPPEQPKRLKLWAEDDAELRRLFAAGRSDQEIGDALGRTPAAVQQRRSVLKLRRGDSSAEGAATRAEAARAESARALERARESLGTPSTTEPSPDPAPAEPAEPVATVTASSPVSSTFRRRLNAFEVGGVQPLGPDRGVFVRIPKDDPLLQALRRAHP